MRKEILEYQIQECITGMEVAAKSNDHDTFKFYMNVYRLTYATMRKHDFALSDEQFKQVADITRRFK